MEVDMQFTEDGFICCSSSSPKVFGFFPRARIAALLTIAPEHKRPYVRQILALRNLAQLGFEQHILIVTQIIS